ncbi:hypothetical protein, partial [Desulfocucumis palustris]
KLAIKIKRHEELMAVNDTSLAWMRVVGIFLNALLIPAFFAVQLIVPDAEKFFINVPMGKAVVAVAFLSYPVGIMLDHRLHDVKY